MIKVFLFTLILNVLVFGQYNSKNDSLINLVVKSDPDYSSELISEIIVILYTSEYDSGKTLSDKLLKITPHLKNKSLYINSLIHSYRFYPFEEKIKMLLIPKDPDDDKNVIIEIRAGTGGEEASLFAGDLFRMYSKYADSKKWKVEILSINTTGLKGIKEVIAIISGNCVYSNLKYESGVHRVQRVPVTEASGRIHTSTATVAVLPEADEIDVKIDDKDLEIEVCRASGPGGQGVNTTDSAVRVIHKPTGIVVSCQDERSQQKNKARALKILRARLFEMELEAQEKEIASARRSQVGSGERAEKIRTYNFPQNRVTDHRIGFTSHKLDMILDGDIEELVIALRTYYQAEALKKGSQ